MALFQRINLGSFSNDGTGDKLKQAGEKINAAWDTLEVILDKPISDAQAAISAANSAASSASAASSSQTAAAGSATTATGAIAASAASAAAALVSQNAAAGSATTAGNSATAAGNSATAAGNSATAAGNSQTAADTSATNAGTSATLSQDWAVKTTALVGGIDYSAKEFAIGTQAGTGGSSKNWAQQTGTDVTGAAANSRSARSWSQDSLIGATLGGSAKDWAQYTGGTVDGTNYSAKYHAGLAATSATSANTSAGNAATSETNAAASAARLTGTSTTSLAIGTGAKVFTTQAGKDFNVGTSIYAIDSVDTTRYMFGTITDYTGTALTVNVVATNSTGTYASWNLYGRAGPQGAAAAGTGDFVGPASSTLDYIVTFGDTTGKLGKNSGKVIPAGAVVGTTDTQTLTNKTLTSPAIATPTGIVKGDVGLGNVDNTSNTTERAATATLTNKTISLTSNTVSGTITEFNTALSGADFVTLAGTETLTNKTLTSPTITGISSTASGIWAGTSTTTYTTPKNIADSEAHVTLTSSTSIATDCSTGTNFFVTLAHNTTFGAPTNAVDGKTYSWLIQQDGTGSRTGAWNAVFEFAATPTLSTTAAKRDLVTAKYHAASGTFTAGFRKSS